MRSLLSEPMRNSYLFVMERVVGALKVTYAGFICISINFIILWRLPLRLVPLRPKTPLLLLLSLSGLQLWLLLLALLDM